MLGHNKQLMAVMSSKKKGGIIKFYIAPKKSDKKLLRDEVKLSLVYVCLKIKVSMLDLC